MEKNQRTFPVLVLWPAAAMIQMLPYFRWAFLLHNCVGLEYWHILTGCFCLVFFHAVNFYHPLLKWNFSSCLPFLSFTVLQVQPGKMIANRGLSQAGMTQLTTLLQTSGNTTRLITAPVTSSMITTAASDSSTTTSSATGILLNGQLQHQQQLKQVQSHPQLLQTQQQQLKVSQAQAQGVLRGKGQARFLVIKSNKRKYY